MERNRFVIDFDSASQKLLTSENVVALGETFDVLMRGVTFERAVTLGLFADGSDSPIWIYEGNATAVGGGCVLMGLRIATEEAHALFSGGAAFRMAALTVTTTWNGETRDYGFARVRLYAGGRPDGKYTPIELVDQVAEHNKDPDAHPDIRAIVGSEANARARGDEAALEAAKSYADLRVAGLLKICGVVDTVEDLPDVAVNGNVYIVRADGSEYLWLEDAQRWERLGPILDLSGYATIDALKAKVDVEGGTLLDATFLTSAQTTSATHNNNAAFYGHYGPLGELGCEGARIVPKTIGIRRRSGTTDNGATPLYLRVLRVVDGAWVVAYQSTNAVRMNDTTVADEPMEPWKMSPVGAVSPIPSDEPVAIVAVADREAAPHTCVMFGARASDYASGGLSGAIEQNPAIHPTVAFTISFDIGYGVARAFSDYLPLSGGKITGDIVVGNAINLRSNGWLFATSISEGGTWLSSKYSRKLTAGDNIKLTPQTDGTVEVSAAGGGGMTVTNPDSASLPLSAEFSISGMTFRAYEGVNRFTILGVNDVPNDCVIIETYNGSNEVARKIYVDTAISKLQPKPTNGHTVYGDGASANSNDDTAIGKSANALGGCTAVGRSAWARLNSVSLGGFSYADSNCVAIGTSANTYGNSVAVGDSSRSAYDSVALGAYSFAPNYSSTAVGYQSKATAWNTSAFGAKAINEFSGSTLLFAMSSDESSSIGMYLLADEGAIAFAFTDGLSPANSQGVKISVEKFRQLLLANGGENWKEMDGYYGSGYYEGSAE